MAEVADRRVRRPTIDLDRHLRAISAGDAEAFARWLAGAEPEIRRSLRSFAATVDTEAAIQEALLRAWQLAPKIERDGRPNALLRFALVTARRLAIDEARRSHRAPLECDEAAEASAALHVPAGPDPLLRRAIEECRKLLPTKPAAALRQRVESGGADPDRVLAARLGMRLNTFLQNVTRARRLLADCLEKRGVDLEAELA